MDWVKVADIINHGRHRTVEGLNEIKRIKEQMNKVRIIHK
jgi:hypothetical protein